MKKFLFWILVLYSPYSFCQSADSITRITFRYDKGHYTFGQSGHYSISEIVEYSPTGTAFLMDRHLQIKKFYDSVSKMPYTDTVDVNVSHSPITKSTINNLIQELNTSRQNYTTSFLKPYLYRPSRKKVLSVMDRYDLKWMLEKQNSDRSERGGILLTNKAAKSVG